MIYELRVYEVAPGKLGALHDRFSKITLRFFEKYGISVVGFWTDDVGVSNRLTYIVKFEDSAQRDKAWAGFKADQERMRLFAETEKEGVLVTRVTNKIMKATPYSPLK
jgi:hypothetical protein